VHDGVGDEFADDEYGVVGDPAGEVLVAGHPGLLPVADRGPYEGAG